MFHLQLGTARNNSLSFRAKYHYPTSASPRQFRYYLKLQTAARASMLSRDKYPRTMIRTHVSLEKSVASGLQFNALLPCQSSCKSQFYTFLLNMYGKIKTNTRNRYSLKENKPPILPFDSNGTYKLQRFFFLLKIQICLSIFINKMCITKGK